jgi:hypothetical protein
MKDEKSPTILEFTAVIDAKPNWSQLEMTDRYDHDSNNDYYQYRVPLEVESQLTAEMKIDHGDAEGMGLTPDRIREMVKTGAFQIEISFKSRAEVERVRNDAIRYNRNSTPGPVHSSDNYRDAYDGADGVDFDGESF